MKEKQKLLIMVVVMMKIGYFMKELFYEGIRGEIRDCANAHILF